VVEVRGVSERVGVGIRWAGGATTEGVVIRPVAKLEQLRATTQSSASASAASAIWRRRVCPPEPSEGASTRRATARPSAGRSLGGRESATSCAAWVWWVASLAGRRGETDR
jgi:hypothetical protein